MTKSLQVGTGARPRDSDAEGKLVSASASNHHLYLPAFLPNTVEEITCVDRRAGLVNTAMI